MLKLCVAGLLGLLAAGCVPSAPPLWLVQPADPTVGSRSPRYVNVTSGVRKFGIVEPKDWRELNRSVGPQAGQGGSMGDMHGMSMGPKRGSGDSR